MNKVKLAIGILALSILFTWITVWITVEALKYWRIP